MKRTSGRKPLSTDPSTPYRPYRRGLQVTFASVAVVGIVYLLACIGVAIFGRDPGLMAAAASGGDTTAPTPLECQRDVARLLDKLLDRSTGLTKRLGEPGLDVLDAWESEHRAWRIEWQRIGLRCELFSLGDQPRHPELIRISRAHASLDEVAARWTALLARVVDEQGALLEELRHDLEDARKILEAEKKG